jgi:hypothetical protein
MQNKGVIKMNIKEAKIEFPKPTKEVIELFDKHNQRKKELDDAKNVYNDSMDNLRELLFYCEGEGVWEIIGKPLGENLIKINDSINKIIDNVVISMKR